MALARFSPRGMDLCAVLSLSVRPCSILRVLTAAGTTHKLDAFPHPSLTATSPANSHHSHTRGLLNFINSSADALKGSSNNLMRGQSNASATSSASFSTFSTQGTNRSDSSMRFLGGLRRAPAARNGKRGALGSLLGGASKSVTDLGSGRMILDEEMHEEETPEEMNTTLTVGPGTFLVLGWMMLTLHKTRPPNNAEGGGRRCLYRPIHHSRPLSPFPPIATSTRSNRSRPVPVDEQWDPARSVNTSPRFQLLRNTPLLPLRSPSLLHRFLDRIPPLQRGPQRGNRFPSSSRWRGTTRSPPPRNVRSNLRPVPRQRRRSLHFLWQRSQSREE